MPVQSFQNIFIFCLRRCKDLAVIDIHVRSGNIPDGNKPRKLIAVRNRQGDYIIIPHKTPSLFQGNIPGHSLRLPYLYIPHLCPDILYIHRRMYPKALQNVLTFFVEMSRTHGNVIRIFV